MVNKITAGAEAGIRAPDTTVFRRVCSSGSRTARHLAPAPLTVHVVSQRRLQLGQRAAPGAQLQQRQRGRRAQRRHDEVGAVLRLGERAVEAHGEAAVELVHAVLQAAVAVAPLQQPRADQERSHRQATHILSGGGGEASTRVQQEAPKKLNPLSLWYKIKKERDGASAVRQSIQHTLMTISSIYVKVTQLFYVCI